VNGTVEVARALGGGHWVGRFAAMASPCEVLVEAANESAARQIVADVAAEAWRIESKFSRYRGDSVVTRINTAGGVPVTVDDETAGLLAFADRCHQLSGGLFDVTTGVLRRVWCFDGSDRLPSRKQVKILLPLVGWEKVVWAPPVITLPAGMEIDLGGLGKEYAVDRAAELVGQAAPSGLLVNFGGDLRAFAPPAAGHWDVGVEDPARSDLASRSIRLARGGLATSGDTRRYLLRAGARYGHILNPRTGWPVAQAPHTVTVLADSCVEAGLLATLAMLQGRRAEAFLAGQGVQHWCERGGRAA
jgi:thiamine biosynthesis lipoprotein